MHFCSCGSKDGFKVHENFQTAAFESTRNFKLTSQFPKMIFLFCFAFQTILAQKNTVIISGSKGLYENNLNAQRVVGQPRFNASCDEFSLHLAAQCEAWSKILIIIGYIIYIISKKISFPKFILEWAFVQILSCWTKSWTKIIRVIKNFVKGPQINNLF